MRRLARLTGEPDRSAGGSAAGTGLTREQVVQAALELLDAVGLEALSMRGLAERLGVRAASLYWHLRDKDQLLGLLAEAILAEVPEPTAGAGRGWRLALETFALGYRRVLLSHRDAARVVAGPQSGPVALRLYDLLVGLLLDAGLVPDDAADAAVLLLAQWVPAFVAGETGPAAPSGGRAAAADRYRVPLGAVESGRLTVGGGVSRLRVRADLHLSDLFSANFEGRPPNIDVDGGSVGISGLGHGRGRRLAGELVLSGAVAWDIELNGGVRSVALDLEAARLRSLEISGGASEVSVALGRPTGTVPIFVNGGASRVSILRPPGTALRAHVLQGARGLALDEMYFGSVGGETRWQSPDFASADDRWDVEVRGGASWLSIGTTGGEAGGEAPAGAAPGTARPGPEEHPSLALVAARMADPNMDERFRFALDVMLGGLERRLGPRAGSG